MSDLMKVSSNPHIRSKDSISRIMLAVIIALLPTTIFGIYNFGIRALLIVAITIASTVLTEFVFEKITKRKNTIGDLSAVVTGLLLALNLPVSVPWWIGAVGGIFAILVVKMLFGGLGQNFMNPALGARCFLLISFAPIMTNFICDAYTGATPLAAVKAGENVNVLDMVIGRTSGTIGETSMLCIVLGACLLIWLEIIDLRIPATYIISFVVFMVLFGGHGLDRYYISSQLAGGGLMPVSYTHLDVYKRQEPGMAEALSRRCSAVCCRAIWRISAVPWKNWTPPLFRPQLILYLKPGTYI